MSTSFFIGSPYPQSTTGTSSLASTKRGRKICGKGLVTCTAGFATVTEEDALGSTRRPSVNPGDKVKENRLRRKLDRMGFQLRKSKRKDPDAVDFGKYVIFEPGTTWSVYGNKKTFDLSLDNVEVWIRQHTSRPASDKSKSWKRR
jgi:hypothetical protein